MNAFIGVPEKGRNSGKALKEKLPEEFDTDFLLDVLNGAGKLYAREGLNRRYIERAVDKLDPVEFRDTGSNFRRPIFTRLEMEDEVIKSYEEPIEEDLDRFYMGIDRFVEDNLSGNEIDRDLYSEARETAAQNGYRLENLYGEEVKWAAMGTELEEPEKVLIPEDFSGIAEAAAEAYWDCEPEYGFFEDYSGELEEEILDETPDGVAGVYMFVSGDTAEDYGLEYEAIPGFESRLGRFDRQAENRFKNSEESLL